MAYYKFFKAQISSFTASLIDFVMTVMLVELTGIWYLTASVIGTIAGGVTNYFVNRIWSFKSTRDRISGQAFRYFHIWTGSILLNASGMWLLTTGLGIDYVISKIIISFVVGLGFNYPLQKKYVFKEKSIRIEK